jgi:hypothetical protein
VTAPWRLHYAVVTDTMQACSFEGSPSMFGGVAADTADGSVTLDFGDDEDLPCGVYLDVRLTFEPMFDWVPEADEIVANAIAIVPIES